MAERYDRWRNYDDEGYRRDDRGVVDRAGDEVRSWFGDEEAAARRRRDEAEDRAREWRAHPERGREWRGERYREPGGRFADEYPQERATQERPRRYFGDYGSAGFVGSAYGAGRDEDWRYRGPYAQGQYQSGRGWAGRNDEWEDRRPFDDRRQATDYGSASSSWPGSSGNYAGKGPRGYHRSDERIKEEICDRLTEDPMIDASEVTVDVTAGEVILAGTVADRWQKRRAEDVAERVGGVRDVTNHVRVNRGHEPGVATSTWQARPDQSGSEDSKEIQPEKRDSTLGLNI
jgi:osmotically-inducible protein OsmY